MFQTTNQLGFFDGRLDSNPFLDNQSLVTSSPSHGKIWDGKFDESWDGKFMENSGENSWMGKCSEDMSFGTVHLSLEIS